MKPNQQKGKKKEEDNYNEGVRDTLTDLKDWIEAYLTTLKK